MSFHLLFLLLPLVHSLRLAILNDIHLNLTYDNTCTWLQPFCYDHGKYELDPPPALLDTILADMKYNYGNVDAVLLQGDMLAHGLSVSDSS